MTPGTRRNAGAPAIIQQERIQILQHTQEHILETTQPNPEVSRDSESKSDSFDSLIEPNIVVDELNRLDLGTSSDDSPDIPVTNNTVSSNQVSKKDDDESNNSKDRNQNSNGVDANVEEEDDDDGWITPSNLVKHKARDSGFETSPNIKTSKIEVACATSDFAMQNVLLQMNLKLLSLDGVMITKTKNWVLRCHACFK